MAGWHGADPRPPVWVGHIALGVADPDASKEFFLALGMRDAAPDSKVPILELRGGTHLILLATDSPPERGTRAPFDLMVDDIDRAHRSFDKLGFEPSAIEKSAVHRSFTLSEPGGYEIVVNSTHATDLPV
ncbi:MAG: VOC family protein [Myxococcota bacterium]